MTAIDKRYDFVGYFDAEYSNPNGDPNGGAPRQDDAGYGYVTDVCLKHKIRRYVDLVHGNEKGRAIILVAREGDTKSSLGNRESKANTSGAADITRNLCGMYYDVRTFGYVVTNRDLTRPMSEKGISAKIQGPVQFAFSKSVDPIVIENVGITREVGANMANKPVVPYALYRFEGFVSANIAKKTGFSTEDLDLLWESIVHMFDEDRSATRSKMCLRRLVAFEHPSALGACPSWKLLETVSVKPAGHAPSSYADYEAPNVDVSAAEALGSKVLDLL